MVITVVDETWVFPAEERMGGSKGENVLETIYAQRWHSRRQESYLGRRTRGSKGCIENTDLKDIN
jgi:hypothetical protein